MAISKDDAKVAAALSRESGVPLDDILHGAIERIKQAHEKRKSDSGKFRILCVDKYDSTDFVYGEYPSAEEALKEARRLTEQSRPLSTDHSIATVFLAYDPSGNYIGGDTWVGE